MKLILKSDVKYFFGVKVRGPKKSCMARGPDHGLVGPPLKPPLTEVVLLIHGNVLFESKNGKPNVSSPRLICLGSN